MVNMGRKNIQIWQKCQKPLGGIPSFFGTPTVFSMCGALMTEEPREIIIYMKYVSPTEIAEFEERQKP